PGRRPRGAPRDDADPAPLAVLAHPEEDVPPLAGEGRPRVDGQGRHDGEEGVEGGEGRPGEGPGPPPRGEAPPGPDTGDRHRRQSRRVLADGRKARRPAGDEGG